MYFHHSEKTQELIEKLNSFMDEFIYPNESTSIDDSCKSLLFKLASSVIISCFLFRLFEIPFSFSLFSENGNSKSSSIWFSPDISSGSVTSISKTDFVISLKTKSFDSDVIFSSNSCF